MVKYCYKGVDLKWQCYTKLKARNPALTKQYLQYVLFFYTENNYFYLIPLRLLYKTECVQYVHASKIITSSEFSGAISLRSRHLVDQEKNKENALKASTKKQHQKYLKNKKDTDCQERSSSPEEVLIENFDCE